MRAQVGIHFTSYDSVTLVPPSTASKRYRHMVDSRPPSSVTKENSRPGSAVTTRPQPRPLHEALRSTFVVTDKGGALGRTA